MRLHSLAEANEDREDEGKRVRQIAKVFRNFIISCKDHFTPPDDKPTDDEPSYSTFSKS